MKTVKLIMILAVMLLLLSSCDRRGSIVTGTPEYLIYISADPTTITIADSSAISVVVSEDLSNEPVDGVVVRFYAIDFGAIAPVATSSSVNPNGLDQPVYFIPGATVGVARVVGQSISSSGLEVTDSDTVSIIVN